MKKINLFFIILILSACTPQVTVTSEVTVTLTPPPQIENTQIVPTPTETEMTIEETAQALFAGKLTEAQIAALTPDQRYKIYQLAANWVVIDGKEINSNVLNESMRKELSIVVTEKRNDIRGANPVIYTDESGAKFYIDPLTGDFLPVDNGTTAEQQTIEMYLSRVVDDEGFTHVYYNNEWLKIEGSDKIQFDNFDNFPWPAGEAIDPKWVNDSNLLGLTVPEYSYTAGKGKITMIPALFFNKEIGQINIPGFGETATLMPYVIIEDDRYSVRATPITGQPNLYADGISAGNPGRFKEGSAFLKELKIGDLYYLMLEIDQKDEFATSYPKSDGKEVNTDYEGLAPSDQVYDIITGERDSNDLTLTRVISVVKAGQGN